MGQCASPLTEESSGVTLIVAIRIARILRRARIQGNYGPSRPVQHQHSAVLSAAILPIYPPHCGAPGLLVADPVGEGLGPGQGDTTPRVGTVTLNPVTTAGQLLMIISASA